MIQSEPPESRHEDHHVIHELRNAINAMVSSAKCLALCPEIPADFRSFVTAIEVNGGRARILLDQIHGKLGA